MDLLPKRHLKKRVGVKTQIPLLWQYNILFRNEKLNLIPLLRLPRWMVMDILLNWIKTLVFEILDY
jgi:hypothetical protein